MTTGEFTVARERASYRVSYPPGYPEHLMPHVILHPDTPATFEDWSETGLRIQLPEPTTLVVHDVVRLTLTPHAADPIEVEGTVVRSEGVLISVRLKPPALPWKVLLDEQRTILAWEATRIETVEEVEAKLRRGRRTIDELT